MTETRKARLRLLLRLVLIVTLCFIWGNSLLGREDSASLSLGFTAWLHSIGLPVSEHFVRKSAHFCEFGLLGVETALLFWLRGGLGFQNGVNSAFACLLAGVTDETIQSFRRAARDFDLFSPCLACRKKTAYPTARKWQNNTARRLKDRPGGKNSRNILRDRGSPGAQRRRILYLLPGYFVYVKP